MIVKLLKSVRRDLRMAAVTIVRNSMAGSILVPQVVRTLIYRMLGMPIASFNIREGQLFENTNVRIGDRTYVSRGCWFEGKGRVDIGSDCQVGTETMFITSTHERLPDGTIDNTPTTLDIVVEDGVWIGARSIVLPGTVIERNCIIGAGAVVRGRCLAGLAYGGVPAKLLSSVREDQLTAGT